MTEKQQPAVAAEFAKSSHGGFRSAFHGLDRGQYGRVMLVGELGDAVKEAGDGLNLCSRHGLRDSGIHLAIDVADEENSFLGCPDHTPPIVRRKPA